MSKNDDGNSRRQKFLADGTLMDIVDPKAILSRNIRLPSLSNSDKINLIIKGYPFYNGGYGIHTRELLFGIGDNYPNFNVKLDALPTPVDVDVFTERRLLFYQNNPININQAIEIAACCPAHAKAYPNNNRKFTIMHTMVETLPMSLDREPGSYIAKWLEPVDEIWVPSHYDRQRFDGICASSKLKVMNLGVRTDLFHPDVSPIEILNTKDKFVFLVDSTWSPRKGIKYILKAFSMAFKKSDPVVLLLMTKYGTRPYGYLYPVCSWLWGKLRKQKYLHKLPGVNLIEYYGDSYWNIPNSFKRIVEEEKIDLSQTPEICLLDIPIHEKILPHFYASAYCLVGASLGESTWLPGIQALSMDIPIIQMRQNWGGYGEYIDTMYPYLYDNDGMIDADEELTKGTSDYYANQQFPKPDVTALARRMRLVFDDYATAKQETKLVGDVIRANWDWDEKLKPVVKRLEDIHATIS